MIRMRSSHFFGALLLLFGLMGVRSALADVAARIVFATGNASIVAADGSVRRAERGGEIASGEVAESRDGKMQLRFLDGATMSLQPETRFRVDQFRFTDQGGKAGSEDRSFFSLLKGGFRTVTGLIGKQNNKQYRVETAVGTIGIRGTDYSGQLASSGLAVSTFAGVVEVCNDAGCTQVGAGQSVIVPDSKTKPSLQIGGSSKMEVPGSGLPQLPEVQQQAVIPAQEQAPSTGGAPRQGARVY